MAAKQRCPWCAGSELDTHYHDTEWGVPLRDDRGLFELLTLEGAQAGLSWRTILAKRDNYRRAFDDFDVAKVARYGEARVRRLLGDPGIVRNRLKVQSTVGNARAVLALCETESSFAAFLWRFVDGQPVQNRWRSMAEVPASSPVSDALSKALKQRGFRFVGSTICYAFMQASGMVNDHLTTCFRHRDVREAATRKP